LFGFEKEWIASGIRRKSWIAEKKGAGYSRQRKNSAMAARCEPRNGMKNFTGLPAAFFIH